MLSTMRVCLVCDCGGGGGGGDVGGCAQVPSSARPTNVTVRSSVSTSALVSSQNGTLYGATLTNTDEDFESERLRRARERAMTARTLVADGSNRLSTLSNVSEAESAYDRDASRLIDRQNSFKDRQNDAKSELNFSTGYDEGEDDSYVPTTVAPNARALSILWSAW